MFMLLMCGLHQAEYDAEQFYIEHSPELRDICGFFFFAAVVLRAY
jgi:hypothetical protein